MSFLELPPPDWETLCSDETDVESWLAARARKLAMAAERAPRILATGRELDRRGALFACTPDVLVAVPYAARFYIDMLALTPKTLNAVVEGKDHGFTRKPESIAGAYAAGRMVSEENAVAFSRFINDQIAAAVPVEFRTFEVAVGSTLMTEGVRVHGSVQNAGGSDAVVLLKSLLVAALEERGHTAEVSAGRRSWESFAEAADALARPRMRFDSRLVCEFTAGGNRPDITVTLDGVVYAVGEVKGRKDLSNAWESWLPNISGHLRTWTSEFPDAPRLFFGTIITNEMIMGLTSGGTQHAGLRTLNRNGLLTAAYNLSLLSAGDPPATLAFAALADGLSALLRREAGAAAAAAPRADR